MATDRLIACTCAQSTGTVLKIKKPKPLEPDQALRKVAALDKFLENGDISLRQYHKMKDKILAAMTKEEK
jgi:hypothetical protein